MRAKRTHTPPAPAPDDEHPPDATGLTIDWIVVQATGSGGAGILGSWIVVLLAAVRAGPFLIGRTVRRVAGRRSDRA